MFLYCYLIAWAAIYLLTIIWHIIGKANEIQLAVLATCSAVWCLPVAGGIWAALKVLGVHL